MSLQYDEKNSPYIQLGKFQIKLEYEEITDKYFKEKASEELRETPEFVEKGLKDLKKLLKETPNLHVPFDNDEYLLKFLRPCKFYPESALELVSRFYRFKEKNPTYCRDVLPSKVRKVYDEGIIQFQEPRDQHGRRVMLIECGEKWRPREVPLALKFGGVQLALEAAMVEPKTQVAGVIVILDMRGLSLTQVMQFTPSTAKLIVDWIQDCIPIRLKAVHIVNQPYIFNMVFAIFKPFLREKTRSRVHFHGSNREKLVEMVGASALRSRHGGDSDIPDVPGELLAEMLLKYEEEFELAASFGFKGKEKNGINY